MLFNRRRVNSGFELCSLEILFHRCLSHEILSCTRINVIQDVNSTSKANLLFILQSLILRKQDQLMIIVHSAYENILLKSSGK